MSAACTGRCWPLARISRWILCLGALLAACQAGAWNAADDEANRQRAMQRMRDSAARTDRSDSERAARQQAQNERANAAANSRTGSSNPDVRSPVNGEPSAESSTSGGSQSSLETITSTVYVPLTPEQTVARARRDAASGDAKYQNYLAQMYYAGYLVPRNDELARRWFEASARQGHAASQGQYGYFLAQGVGGPKDVAEGLKWLRLGADQGDGAAESFYGTALLVQGIRDPKFDPRPALAYAVRGAEKGEVTAQAMLGLAYQGMEVWRLQANPAQAVRWLRAAADQGEANSMETLADYYLTGTGGLTADPLVALKLLRDAAAKKQPAAFRKLAAYHAEGLAGLTPSMPEALKLLQQSADLGDLMAQYQYGAMLLQDPKNADPATGLAYLRCSADGNFYLALDYLAREYFIGKRLPRDLRQAVALARRSIDNGLEPPHAPTLALLADPEMVRAAAELDSAAKRF